MQVSPTRRIRAALRIGVGAVLLAGLAPGMDFYAAPNGSNAGSRAIGSPWDLQTALNQPGTVNPGDTIWLRGGTYRSSGSNGFDSQLNGTASSPITVRNYNGEQPVIDDTGMAFGLALHGSYTYFSGIQVTGSPSGSSGYGVAVYGPGIKCINMVVNGSGLGFTSFAANGSNGLVAVSIISFPYGATASGTVPLSAAVSSTAGVAGVQFQLDGNNLGAEMAQAPYTFNWDTTSAAAGTHSITALARDAAGNLATASSAVTVNNAGVGSPTTSANFVGLDSTTQGNWKSKYGSEGYTVVDDSAKVPTYATGVTSLLASDYSWNSSTTDVRALQKSSASDRLATTWYSPSFFYVDLNFTDKTPHQVAVYCMDWDYKGRTQTVDVLDANTSAVLDTRSISNFSNGVYVVWNVTGHVKLRITQTNSSINAVVNGVFFGGSGPAATFVATDTTTQGNWRSKYGGDGYTVVDDSSKNPTYAAGVTSLLAADYSWNSSTTDVRALQKPAAADRLATTWYSSSFFYVDLNFTDQASHQVAIYCMDWDYKGRTQTVDVLDANTNAVLDTRSISNFSNGIYLVWNVTGHVKLRVTQTNSSINAVVSGIFFGGRSGPSATFLAMDTTTGGSWKSKYGSGGYTVIDDSSAVPSYATITPSQASDYVWASSTADLRGLQKGTLTGRIASTWYSPSTFYVDLNITDPSSHQVAVYCLDWDYKGRVQTVDVLDPATNAVLDTRSISNFSNGVYLVWNIAGHVKLRFTQNSSTINAVSSGFFFGP